MTDLDLISRIKKERDSQAVSELVNRHTGVYMTVINQYSSYPRFTHRTNVNDLRDDHTLNIYQWAQSYDPSRGMKFGTYVGQMTKFMCKGILTDGQESVEFDESISPSNDTSVTDVAEKDSDLTQIAEEVGGSDEPLFRRIFKLRFGGVRQRSWRDIGKMVGLTHEGARKCYLKHIGFVKENVGA